MEAQKEAVYSAKAFYELAGVKRSTVRHFIDMGLLKPAYIKENGYAVYGNSQLLDIICLKNERSLDFSIQDIETTRKADLDDKIKQIEQQQKKCEQEIDTLRRKIETMEMYRRVLSEMIGHKDKIRIDYQGRKTLESFWISRTVQLSPKKTAEEIAHCIERFPVVRVILHGKLNNMENPAENDISMEIGYFYDRSQSDFVPRYPELYQTIPASPCVLLRTMTSSPLVVDRGQLTTILASMKGSGLKPAGDVYTYVHAVENLDEGNRYYVTIRLVAEKTA